MNSNLHIQPPKHAFDIKAMQKMAERVNSLSHAEFVTGKNSRAFVGASKTVYQLEEQAFDKFHPFKIYNVPADKASNPKAAYRTFRIRDGMVYWKSKYGFSDFDNPNKLPVSCVYGTDGFIAAKLGAGAILAITGSVNDFNYWSDEIYPASNYIGWRPPMGVVEMNDNSIIYNAAVDIYGNILPTEFILGIQPDTGSGIGTPGVYGASFWISIKDSPTPNLTIQLQARMITGTISDFAFPSDTPDETIIPIGTIWNETTGLGMVETGSIEGRVLSVQQYLSEHILPQKTFLCDSQSYSVWGNMTYRGDWTNDSLSGQYFSGGDLISFYQYNPTFFKSAGVVDYYNGGSIGLWLYVGQDSIITDDPTNYYSPTYNYWTQISGLF